MTQQDYSARNGRVARRDNSEPDWPVTSPAGERTTPSSKPNSRRSSGRYGPTKGDGKDPHLPGCKSAELPIRSRLRVQNPSISDSLRLVAELRNIATGPVPLSTVYGISRYCEIQRH